MSGQPMGHHTRTAPAGVWLPENADDDLDERSLEEAIARARRADYAALRDLGEVA